MVKIHPFNSCLFVLLVGVLMIGGCEETPAPSNSGEEPLSQRPQCTFTGEILDENQIWIADANTLVSIVADASTQDKELGASHRVFQVRDATTCAIRRQLTLPVNQSSDYAYYLAEINYNNESRLVGIRGFDRIFLYDLREDRLLPPLQPRFSEGRLEEDAQSGMIHRLEVWENFLIGYAEDRGAFAFMIEGNQARPIPAYAEYQREDKTFGSLFVLPSGNRQQIIMPVYEEEEFLINPLFDEPVRLQMSEFTNPLQNRYVVLRSAGERDRPVLVDLRQRARMELPDEVSGGTDREILQWAEQQ